MAYFKEEWRRYYKIPGMLVSNKGKIRRIANFQGDMDYFQKNSYALKPTLKNGHLVVKTRDHGELRIDKLVETCFHGKVEFYHEVVHIDGNEFNCKIDNLRKKIRPECYDENGLLIPEAWKAIQEIERIKAEKKAKKEEEKKNLEGN